MHETVTWIGLLKGLGVATAYSVLGVVVFLVAFRMVVALAPFSVRKEIETDHNVALAIIIGSVLLGLAIIIGHAVG